MNALTERALAIAITQDGVRETSRNRSPEIDSYNNDIGHDPEKRDPWCAIFVCAMFIRACRQLGIKCPVPLTAGCWSLDERSPAAVKTNVAAPGAIFILKGHKHVGFVVAVLPDGTLATMEGNTNADGSPEGNQARQRIRRPREIELYLDFGLLDFDKLPPLLG